MQTRIRDANVQFSVSVGPKLLSELESYRKRKEIPRTIAIRQLLELGLRAQERIERIAEAAV